MITVAMFHEPEDLNNLSCHSRSSLGNFSF